VGEGSGLDVVAERRLRRVSDRVIVCAEQRMNQEGSSPSGARMRSAVSKSGGNASLAEARGRYVRSLMRHEGESRKQARRTWSHRSTCFGGQGVRREVGSEGYAEKYRAVIDWGRPRMNRSAKDGIRSSPHYGGEGVTHSPIVPRCLLTARYGRFMRDLRRPVGVLVFNQVSGPNGRRCSGRSRRT
jgi:hypothetical protein